MTSTSSAPGSPSSDLITQLDKLLAEYLETLDSYQTLRAELSRSFSAGFMALSQANRTSTMGPGRRYGEDGYDQRMKAQRRVHFEIQSGEVRESSFSIRTVNDTDPASGKDSREPTKREKSRKITSEQGEKESKSPALQAEDDAIRTSHLPTPPPEITAVDSSAPTSTPITSIKTPRKTPRDPLHWYGILVPPALRTAQTTFTSSVETQIPVLLNVQAELARLEDAVGQARKDLGLVDTGGVGETHLTGEDAASGMEGQGNTPSPPKKPQGSSHERKGRKSISNSLSGRSRPREPPMSRVLKLDN